MSGWDNSDATGMRFSLRGPMKAGKNKLWAHSHPAGQWWPHPNRNVPNGKTSPFQLFKAGKRQQQSRASKSYRGKITYRDETSTTLLVVGQEQSQVQTSSLSWVAVVTPLSLCLFLFIFNLKGLIQLLIWSLMRLWPGEIGPQLRQFFWPLFQSSPQLFLIK